MQGTGGVGDCWTSIDLLTPDDGNNSSFAEEQDMVIGIRTTPIPTTSEQYHSFWGAVEPEIFSQSLFKRLQVSEFKAFNYHHLTFYGTVGLYLTKTDGSETLLLPYLETGKEITPVESGIGYNFSLKTFFLSELSVGTYYAFLASKAVQEDTPQPIKQIGGKYNIYTLTIHEDRSVTVDQKEETNIIPTAIHAIENSSRKIPARYFDLQGREVGKDARGLVIMKQGNTVKKVMK